jgi:hypothetical protein
MLQINPNCFHPFRCFSKPNGQKYGNSVVLFPQFEQSANFIDPTAQLSIG